MKFVILAWFLGTPLKPCRQRSVRPVPSLLLTFQCNHLHRAIQAVHFMVSPSKAAWSHRKSACADDIPWQLLCSGRWILGVNWIGLKCSSVTFWRWCVTCTRFNVLDFFHRLQQSFLTFRSWTNPYVWNVTGQKTRGSRIFHDYSIICQLLDKNSHDISR